MNQRQKNKRIKMINKKLVERYPFLAPRNVFTNKLDEDYDYTYTILDEIPTGWRKAFGYLFIEELREELVRANMLDEYRVLQVKEKYGTLRWYDSGGTKELNDIVRKYEHISEFCCIRCGKLNVPIFDDGWVSPYCEDCFVKMRQRYLDSYAKHRKDGTIEREIVTVDGIKKFIVAQPALEDTVVYTTYSKEGEKETRYYIGDTIEKIKNGENKLKNIFS